MSVPVFIGDFVELPQPGEMLTITGAEAKHISVRRLKPGGTIVLTDGADARVEVELLAVNPQQVQAQVRTAIRSPRPGPPVTVVQALPKSERAELAVDLMVESGVDAIVPWEAMNCVARWSGTAKQEKSRAKWQAAAREAAKQARRLWVPPVSALHSSDDVVKLIAQVRADGGVAAVLHGEEVAPFAEFAARAAAASQVLFIVGPEGGVSPAEVAQFRNAGAESIVLGPTVLRTALAGAAALNALGPLTNRWSGQQAGNMGEQ